MTVLESVMSRESKTVSNHSRILWIAGTGLAFFLGMGVANGYTTQEALQDAKGNCHWTLRHELWKQQRALEGE